jgi:zinc protease
MKRFLTLAAALFATVFAFAQVNPQGLLEKDPEVRSGVLDNGMTYYIRHNNKPANRAEFYFLSKEGAIQETPAQAGLAHFQEHMCLNGSKNFPGKGIINYLQTIGASFGGNINASTGVEQTIYMFNNIPLVRPGVVDTCLLMIHDYSGYVTNDPKEIDDERGVIKEELRTRRNASWRMFEKSLPYYYKGSRYATCNVIGTDDNLANFPYHELQDFYAKWYRTDLQAVVVVGDVNVDQVEAKIKDIFGSIPAHSEPNPKVMFPIPSNNEPIVGVITDPENAQTSFSILYKTDPLPREYRVYGISFLTDLMENLISSMLNERLDDLSKSADAPFLGAQAAMGKLTQTSDAFFGDVSTNNGSEAALKGLYSFLTEVKKAKQYGFTDAEFQRAKTNMLTNYESAAKNADSRQNDQFINGITDEFFNNKPFMTPAYELEQAKGYLSMLDAATIGKAFGSMPDTNMVVVLSAPEKQGIVNPTEAQILETITAAQNATVAAPVEEAVNEPLMDASKLKGSKITKTSNGKHGETIWQLKNGVTVRVRPSELKKDQVLVSAYQPGGMTLVPTDDIVNFDSNVWQLWNSYSGLSKFPATKLQKMLTGKNVNETPYVNGYEHGVSANCSPKDIETLLQLIYLQVTDARFNAEEFAPALAQIKAILPNMENTPNYLLQIRLYKDLFNSNPRRSVLVSSDLDKINLETMKKDYNAIFGNANGMNVVITGNVQLDSLKPMVEKYFGSLPSNTKVKPEWINRHDDFVDGKINDVYPVKMETAKTTYVSVYKTLLKDDLKNNILANMTDYIMDLIYVETIREEEGGTYGVSTSTSLLAFPNSRAITQIAFDTDPVKADKLIAMTRDGLKKVGDEGVTEEQLSKAKENLLKDISESRINNSYWTGVIKTENVFGYDKDTNYEATVKAITAADLQNFVKNIVNSGNLVELTMVPDTTK